MLLHVKVKPGQRIDKLEKTGEGWQIRLKAAPVDGKANEHLVEYLSEILQIASSKIILKKGHTSKFKTLEILMDEKDVVKKLNEHCAV